MSDDNPKSQSNIFGDRESMLRIWIDERRSRDFNASLMWENLKFFSVLISAIITVDTFFLKLTFDGSLPGHAFELSIFSLVFPALVMSLSWFGKNDLKRRWDRTLEAIAHLIKLEDLLGLNARYSGNALEKDNHLFQRFHDSAEGIKSEEEFKQNKMNENNMFTSMKKVYWILGIVGLLLFAYQIYLSLTVGS
jgi:hypothetical protein